MRTCPWNSPEVSSRDGSLRAEKHYEYWLQTTIWTLWFRNAEVKSTQFGLAELVHIDCHPNLLPCSPRSQLSTSPPVILSRPSWLDA